MRYARQDGCTPYVGCAAILPESMCNPRGGAQPLCSTRDWAENAYPNSMRSLRRTAKSWCPKAPELGIDSDANVINAYLMR
jgi:hypothetical protein